MMVTVTLLEVSLRSIKVGALRATLVATAPPNDLFLLNNDWLLIWALNHNFANLNGILVLARILASVTSYCVRSGQVSHINRRQKA